MKFKTTQEAFNYWNQKTLAEIETRSQELIAELDKPEADVNAMNIEVDGLKQAKDNQLEKRNQQKENIKTIFNPITGSNGNEGAKQTMTDTIFETPEYRSAFYKDILGHELTTEERNAMNQAQIEMRATGFNTSTEQANVIPTQTLNEVIRKARTQGGLLAEARGFNLPANFEIPVGTPLTKASWHAEGVEVEGEKNTPGKVSFSANELVKIFSTSVKARKMSVPAFEQYITDELVASIMEALEQSLVSGTGIGEGAGIETITFDTTNSKEYTTAPVYTDFTQTVALLKRGYSKGAKWAMNNATLYNKVYSVVDDNKRPIFIADPKAESIGKILGFDVVVDDNIADGDMYLGNYQYLGSTYQMESLWKFQLNQALRKI